ncbi:hypothetical protein [Paenibacillus donghaensis]|uniref:Uncharacterized protein n=1 Tax=Paenibacillus donghaensis TaxID=414771 RepID=A0A2Z2KBE5_9BACL|nr:hypothetical protein [Paenibacillus donghaensis]ASA23034.1 hypothetical protein B9T62_20815 [Paenibacillus donghaensis]
MFDLIKHFIENLIIDMKNKIIVESEVIYGYSKLEYALSHEDYMASVSILSDFTYDFFIVDIESENTLLVKTKQFKNIDDLLKELEHDLSKFSTLAK